MKIYTVMLAGGAGTRMNTSVNKTLLPLCGKTVIRRSVEAFSGLTDEMVVVCHPDAMEDLIREVKESSVSFPVHFVTGGDTRQQSVQRGLISFDFDDRDIVLVHDAARCLVSPDTISSVIRSVRESGSGVPGIPVTSTYKICDENSFVVQTPDRNLLFEIQTPQGFLAGELLKISLKASEESFEGTDDASLMEHYGYSVRVVPGAKTNLKLTAQEDLIAADLILKGVPQSVRVGMGYDVHRLVDGRKLILCGVEIPFELGLLGHSDADVALHALMDAMLGACALGDIGKHFPDDDERYRGISSLLLLKETARILDAHGYVLNNADITIAAQKPKLLPYIPLMRENISSVLSLPADRISIKATTTEKLGFEGRMEGISSYAVCTVVKKC